MIDQTTLDESSLASLFEDQADTQEVLVARSRAYLDARSLKEDADLLAKRQSELLMAAEVELLRAMDQAGVKSLKIEHRGATCGLTQTQSTYFSLPAGSLENAEIMDWLTAHGAGDIVKQTINHMTFSSFAKELVDQAKGDRAVLHAAVKVLDRRGVQLRKG